MKQFLSKLRDDFKDEFGEVLHAVKKDTTKGVKNFAKGIVQSVAGQVTGGPTNFSSSDASSMPTREMPTKGDLAKIEQIAGQKNNAQNKKIDPVTGKPIPSKPMLKHLQNAVQQLQISRLQKLREELAKQRMKINDGQKGEGTGPEIKSTMDKNKPKPGAVQKMLQQSGETGEMKGGVGG